MPKTAPSDHTAEFDKDRSKGLAGQWLIATTTVNLLEEQPKKPTKGFYR